MTYTELFYSPVLLVVSIAAGGWLGNLVTEKTGRKAIGWPLGVMAFLVLFAVGGMMRG